MVSVNPLYKLAQDEINQGQCQAAEKRLLDYLETNNSDALALHLLGLARMRSDRPAEAIPPLEKAFAEHTGDADLATHLGVCRIRSGDSAGAYSVLKQAMKLNPNQGVAFLNAATAAQNLDQLDAAEACAQRARQLLPQEPAALLVQGQVAQKRQRTDEAIQLYRQALELDADSEQAQELLAGILTTRGELDEAEHLYGAILQRGESFSRRFNYSSVLLQQGRLEEADAQVRAAAQVFLKGEDPVRKTSPKDYMDTDLAVKGLLAFKHAMDDLGVPFFLAFGTLLGIVREGDILGHDKDMDMGVPWSVPREKLLDALRAYDFVCPKEAKVRAGTLGQWMYNVVHLPTRVNIDLFFARREGDTMDLGFDHPAGPLVWRFPRCGLKPIEFRGETFQAPDPVVPHLESIYGSEWQVPNANFDSLLIGHNRLPENHDLALAYGYNRLMGHINDRAWKKAAGYCEQIKQFSDEPLIDQLLVEINQRWATDQQQA